ncbi:NADH-quinone oxidoreductase subunit M, partial [bacterium]|nr:NADH-quinone oxidoreductase subunit M [bacterium]
MTDFFFSHLLSLLIVVPLLGAAGLFIVPRERIATLRVFTLAVTTLNFILSLPLFLHFKDHIGDFQFVEQHDWIPSIGASFHMGVDGISLLMVMLTTLLMPLVILSSWTSIVQRVKEYMIVFLFLETAMIGVFASLDLLLFYVFWESMLIPMYFIIGVWGGERRLYAAIKFFLFTMFGGVLMLVGILVLYFMHSQTTGVATFSYPELNQMIIGRQAQLWLFLAFGLAFAIKVPMVPFHTWLPDAHVEAPTGGSVILAGVLLKMGTYGFLRFCLPLFPDAAASLAPLIGVMAVIGILYGALVSWVQPDLKKLVAYSSV